jgi:hypothetical protein
VTTSPPEDPEVAYFRDIERAFVERRGDPLFISNADWVFLAKLRKRAIPKRVVLRGMTDAFDAHAHSFARKQKIRSLKFCEDQITAAVERYRRAQRADGPSSRGLSDAIRGLEARIAALPFAPSLDEAIAATRRGLLDIAARADLDRKYDATSDLAAIEDGILHAASEVLGAEELRAIEQGARESTAAYQGRMPPAVYETLIGESVRRKTLQHFGLPRLLLAEIE